MKKQEIEQLVKDSEARTVDVIDKMIWNREEIRQDNKKADKRFLTSRDETIIESSNFSFRTHKRLTRVQEEKIKFVLSMLNDGVEDSIKLDRIYALLNISTKLVKPNEPPF